jgi:acetoin utilization deacetylase AcuC-like enzyme
MGFCFLNNVAIAARHALDVRGLERVAVVDFDVHHGNGTEDILAGDERVLMVGIFQHPLYPYSGAVPKGDNMLNLPLAPYTRGPEVRALIEANWLPRLEAFRPQMLFVSAGFDAHRDDELAQLGLVEADYEWITRRIKEVADRHAEGRIVSCLEGGYNLGALARSVAAHLRVLAGLHA